MTRTRRLYHEDPEQKTFEASVISTVGGPEGCLDVVLDQTAFYPTGGGQPHDGGRLGGQSVLDVIEDGEAVVHRLAEPPEGTNLTGEVDWVRRTDHRQQHTGQHILSRAFLDVAGAATVGFHLGEETCTIDLDHEVDEPGVDVAERLANDIVLADVAVLAQWYESLADLPEGLRKEAVVPGPIRILAVGTFDATPCCGTHCARSGQVGPIKVLRTERRRGGIRVEFVCGVRALLDYRARHRALHAAALAFTTLDLQVPERVLAVLAEQKALRAKVELLEEDVRGRLLEAWAGEAGTGAFARTLPDGRSSWLSPLAGTLAGRRGEPVLLASVEGEEARVVLGVPEESGIDAGKVLRPLLEELGGRGGGSGRLGQGKLPRAALPRLLDRWRDLEKGLKA